MPADESAIVPFYGNAHGSTNTLFMLDDANGDDVVPDEEHIVCFKCHNKETYFYNGSQTDYSRLNHSQGACQDAELNVFGIGCMNCHGGGGWGAIHGVNETVTDDNSPFNYEPYIFLYGASFNRWQYEGQDGFGNDIYSCSTKSTTDTFNFTGCTQHQSGQGYTRQYP
jgi:hypothetical protein